MYTTQFWASYPSTLSKSHERVPSHVFVRAVLPVCVYAIAADFPIRCWWWWKYHGTGWKSILQSWFDPMTRGGVRGESGLSVDEGRTVLSRKRPPAVATTKSIFGVSLADGRRRCLWATTVMPMNLSVCCVFDRQTMDPCTTTVAWGSRQAGIPCSTTTVESESGARDEFARRWILSEWKETRFGVSL